MSGGQWERENSHGAEGGGSGGSGSGSGSGSPMAVEKQTLPSISNLTNSVPPLVPSPGSSGHSPSQSSVKTDARDSGNWSMTTTSNHSSFSSPMNLASVTQDQSGNTAPRGSILNPDSQRDCQSLNPPLHSTSRPAPNVLTSPYGLDSSPSNSRRSSFDTRLSALQLNSAQGTPAASQVSLASHIQRERTGGFGQSSPAPSVLETGSHPYTPISPSGHYPTPSVSSAGSGPRNSFGSWSNNLPPTSAPERPGARVAPPIIGSSRYPYPHPNAPSPTKGFPYAFPDPDAAGPTAPNSREGFNATPGQTGGTTPTNRPYGYHQEPNAAPQHSQTSLYSQASNSTTASSHHAAFGTQNSFQELHHHSLQRGASSLGAPSPATPYSRTPELRVSHKLAERKRRKEMKELFDELRDALPAERGGKSSKWEVLTKSIEYLGQMRQQQNNMSMTNQDLAQENQNLSSANDNLNRELERLRAELNRTRTNDHQYHAPPSNGDGGYVQNMSHYGGNAHPAHQGYQHGQSAASHPIQSRPANSDGNQMQGIERSNY
ncbi:hypothetical protein DRE_04511 [Drechslerella stenobrocha 248]|uniref:BHLH domain-containing protein n=1 Tax=Drechslerella stenobrocha 248 TaxID=1043628 RepID=W7IB72_9PEZI|nr:hypothetical protein DRE_04511 [Drechslerella stenobrocha 248]